MGASAHVLQQLKHVRETVRAVTIDAGDELVRLGVKAELELSGAGSNSCSATLFLVSSRSFSGTVAKKRLPQASSERQPGSAR